MMYSARHWSYKSLNVAIVADIFMSVIAGGFKSTLNFMNILDLALRARNFFGRLFILIRIRTKAILELVGINQFFIWRDIANSIEQRWLIFGLGWDNQYFCWNWGHLTLRLLCNCGSASLRCNVLLLLLELTRPIKWQGSQSIGYWSTWYEVLADREEKLLQTSSNNKILIITT